MSKANTTLDEQKREAIGDKKRKMEVWLTNAKFLQTHKSVSGSRTARTGEWLMHTTEFESWLEGSTRVLWCLGNPGTGKTFLASKIFDYLQDKFANSNVGVFCVYCKFDAQETQSASDIFGGICAQSIYAQQSIFNGTESCFDKRRSESKADLETVHDLLPLELARWSQSFLVLDALDECSDYGQRELLLNRLKTLLDLLPKFRILITSRKTVDIDALMTEHKTLEISAKEDDIRRYVRSRVMGLRGKVGETPHLHGQIEDGIAMSSAGMFLLARLNLENFNDLVDDIDIEEAIENLSKGQGDDVLHEVYSKTLDRVEHQPLKHRDLGFLVLSVVFHACAALGIDELRHALAMARRSAVRKGTLINLEDLTKFCGGLVTAGQQDGKVRLVHFTTYTYIDSIRSQKFPEHARFLDGDRILADACFGYIGQFRSEVPEWDEDITDEILAFHSAAHIGLNSDEFLEYKKEHAGQLDFAFMQHPFMFYALRQWAYHTWLAGSGVEKDLRDQILQLEMTPVALKLAAYSIWGIDFDNYCQGVTLLMICAAFGFEATALELLRRGADVNAAADIGSTALHYAVSGGQINMATLLLRHGANPNAKAKKGRTPLHQAVMNMQLQMAKLLVEHGADLNKESYHYLSVLHIIPHFWDVGEEPADRGPEWEAFSSLGELLQVPRLKYFSEGVVSHIDERSPDQPSQIAEWAFKHKSADFDRLGDNLLSFATAEQRHVPEEVLELIRSRVPPPRPWFCSERRRYIEPGEDGW